MAASAICGTSHTFPRSPSAVLGFFKEFQQHLSDTISPRPDSGSVAYQRLNGGARDPIHRRQNIKRWFWGPERGWSQGMELALYHSCAVHWETAGTGRPLGEKKIIKCWWSFHFGGWTASASKVNSHCRAETLSKFQMSFFFSFRKALLFSLLLSNGLVWSRSTNTPLGARLCVLADRLFSPL